MSAVSMVVAVIIDVSLLSASGSICWEDTGQPTCVSTLLLVFSVSSRWKPVCRRQLKWASIAWWSLSTVTFCVGRRHQTRRWTRSDHELCAWRRVEKVVKGRVRQSTTGWTQSAVNTSTISRVHTTYNRTVSTTRSTRLRSAAALYRNHFPTQQL